LIEIGTTNIRLTLAFGKPNESFHIYKTLYEYVHINQHMEDGMIKSAKFLECSSILKMYKKICEADGVKNFITVAAESLTNAKNYKSFIDEMGSVIGQEFTILTTASETSAIYTAVVNSIDVPRGVIVCISSFNTRLIHYSRRMILDSVTVPFGSCNNPEDASKMFDVPWLKNLDPETQLVGVSDVFASYSRIARKMKKYPVDIDHNYVTDTEVFQMVFDFVRGLDAEKTRKLRGISGHGAQTLLCGMTIIDAILKQSGLKTLVNARAYRNTGLLYQNIVPSTLEKPISDLLHHSFNVIADVCGLDKERMRRHNDLAIMLFKQIRVLHKLPRSYAKALNIASNMYKLGKFGDNYHAILNAPILGASHKDIVLAAFSASFKKWEDFDSIEWLKYRDIMTEEDLEAVRKIAMMLTLAEIFDIRGQEIIKDISCDLLGDSVILKLITTTDQKQKVDVTAADVEIFQAKKFTSEFTKTFKRALELL